MTEASLDESSPTKDQNASIWRVLFMGSGEIAIPTLAALVAHPRFFLAACVTQPDRPQGRKRRMTATPVGQWCQQQGLTVHKPASVNADDFLHFLRTLDLDLIVVFSFGQILKNNLLNLPKSGSVNIHTSLLPTYRGAAPIAAAILNGDRQTGVSIMKMAAKLDAGDVFQQFPVELPDTIYAPDLEQRLADRAANEICHCLDQIASGDLKATPQNHEQATYAPRITKEDGHIDWTQPAADIERQVRAYHPWPGAWFETDTRKGTSKITVTTAQVVDNDAGAPPGTFIQADDKHGWVVACGQQALRLERIIPQGRQEMPGKDYLRGRPLQRD